MQYAKAAVAAGIAGVSTVLTGLGDGHLTLTEGATAVLAALVAAGAVWQIPYRGTAGRS